MRYLPHLLLCCLAVPVQASDSAVGACMETAWKRHVDAVHLARDCPQLLREIQQQGLAITEPPLLDKVSMAQLWFFHHARDLGYGRKAIGRHGLQQLLAEVLQPEAPNPQMTWWKALTDWLDQLKSGDYEAQYRWLLRFLHAVTPSATTARLLFYAVLALLVLTSLGFVGMELYYAGVFGKLPGLRRRAAAAVLRPATQHISAATAAGLELLPPRKQLAALLDRVVEALAASGAIPADATLTHRQLVKYADAQAVPDCEAFGRLVEQAEPVLYGGCAASDELLRTFRHDAQLLLDNS